MNSQYKTSVSFGAHKTLSCPEPNEEYLFYQTITGAWPIGAQEANDDFKERIRNYMMKAAKEAKLHTSWTVPNGDYEKALTEFINRVLSDDAFLNSFLPFQRKVSETGKYNSLSQTFVKLTSPGVPDVYQGTELWSLSLVDPDNRRPVDYAIRKKYLKEIKEMLSSAKDDNTGVIAKVLENTDNGMIKLFIIHSILSFRKKNSSLFCKGSYTALKAEGSKSRNIIAFLRENRGAQLISVSSRFFANLSGSKDHYTGSNTWVDTTLQLPASEKTRYKDVLSGKVHTATSSSNGLSLRVSDLFAHLPMSLLQRIEN